MIGIVVATQGELGEAFIRTAESVLGRPLEKVLSVSTNGDPDRLKNKIASKIKKVRGNGGTLILTDMFGGAASDMSYAFFEKGRVEVISAANLPILLKAVEYRDRMDLGQLSNCLQAYGKRSISVAGEILKGNRRSHVSACPFENNRVEICAMRESTGRLSARAIN